MDYASYIPWVVLIGSSFLIGWDAQRIGAKAGKAGGGFYDMNPEGWVLGCLLLWAIFVPLYFLYCRPKYKRAQVEQLAKIEASKMKKCPKCAEMIKSEALKCRYCGTDF